MGNIPSVHVCFILSRVLHECMTSGARFPTLNGISVFCLASTGASESTREVFTNIFGGANGNEGLGLGSLSFDWQYIGSVYMAYVPLP
jgi:hypothetical protein